MKKAADFLVDGFEANLQLDQPGRGPGRGGCDSTGTALNQISQQDIGALFSVAEVSPGSFDRSITDDVRSRREVALVTGSTKALASPVEQMADAGAKVVISAARPMRRKRTRRNRRTRRKLSPCRATSGQGGFKNLVGAKVRSGAGTTSSSRRGDQSGFRAHTQGLRRGVEKIMLTNVKSVIWLGDMVLPSIAERGDDGMIIISSIGALRGSTQLGL